MQITMPQLGESVVEGTVGKWLKAEGDAIEQYEPLLEIITDKVNAEYPSPVTGTLSKILVPEGETVDVDTPIAEIAAQGEAGEADAYRARARNRSDAAHESKRRRDRSRGRARHRRPGGNDRE
ncbi:MAG: lipoyl domain-containing protein [Chloroflexia bacterium]